MNLAGRTILAAALAAAALGTGGAARAEDAGAQPATAPAPAPDPKQWILDMKIRVQDTKVKAAGVLDDAKTEEAKKAVNQVISDLDRIYSILEDKLVND